MLMLLLLLVRRRLHRHVQHLHVWQRQCLAWSFASAQRNRKSQPYTKHDERRHNRATQHFFFFFFLVTTSETF